LELLRERLHAGKQHLDVRAAYVDHNDSLLCPPRELTPSSLFYDSGSHKFYEALAIKTKRASWPLKPLKASLQTVFS
jgi:hypothetical protein